MQKRTMRVFFAGVFLLMLTAITPLSTFAASTSTTTHTPAVINPYSPAYGHSYRHGALPTIAQFRKMKSYQNTTLTTSSNTLAYGGGNIGVTSGKEKVYLVFWGSQWGTQSTNSSGNLTFSKDPDGGAPYLQNLFKGLGTGNELWSGTMTQYCDGPLVFTGTTVCPSGALHVGYPLGGALAGVWYDNSGLEPNVASVSQLANEATIAANHFGNTTAVSNRYAQYMILSPHGTDPDDYQGNGYCAWHSYNADIAYTNLPYIPDAGTNCGQNYVNSGSAGKVDGYSITAGHEYAETITDQDGGGGWTSYYSGQETGDECAWNPPGTDGGAANLTLGHHSFAMQATWSNDTESCLLSHAIIGDGTKANDFSISANPAILFLVRGQSSTHTISTSVTNGSVATISLSASVAPVGPTLSLSATSVTGESSSTLTVSAGSAVAPGTYEVTVKGIAGSITHSTPVTVIVISSSSGIANGGFETAGLADWITTAGATSVSSTAHSGNHSAMVGGTSISSGDSTIQQTFIAPTGVKTLTFWYQVNCPDSLQYDWATANLSDNTSTTTTTILDPTCNTNATWVKVTASVKAGHSYTLALTSHDDDYPGTPTYTLFDDVSLS